MRRSNLVIVDQFPTSYEEFTYIRQLGHSHFGEVWKVENSKTNQQYTLKKIPKASVSKIMNQFRREINTLYKINHPNIAKMHKHFEDDLHFYLIMESIDGITLSQKLSVEKKFSEATAADFLLKVIDAISYLHSLDPPVVYKYIKPDNIIVESTQNIKLIDFCWASIRNEENTVIGHSTLEYLAPEMFSRHEFTISIDIWCIGVLLYEMIEGKSPFKKNSTLGILTDIQKCSVLYPEDISFSLKDLFDRIFIKEPSERLNLSEIAEHIWVRSALEMEKSESLPSKIEEEFSIELSGSVNLLKNIIKKKKKENQKTLKQISGLETEIDWENSQCAKKEIEVKEASEGLGLLSKKVEKVRQDFELADEETGKFETEPNFDKKYLDCWEKKMVKLAERREFLLQVREEREKNLQELEVSNFNLRFQLSELKKQLNPENVSKIMKQPFLLFLFKLMKDWDTHEINLLNKNLEDFNSSLQKSCDDISAKIEDLKNLSYLKERSICELSILYQEKTKEMQDQFLSQKVTIMRKKTLEPRSISKKLKTIRDVCLEQIKENEDSLEDLVDPHEVNRCSLRVIQISEKFEEVSKKIKMTKRDILKMKVRKYEKSKTIEKKKNEISSLADDLIGPGYPLSLLKARKLF